MELCSGVLTPSDPDFEMRVQKNVDQLETNNLRQNGKYESKYKGVYWSLKHQAWKVIWTPKQGENVPGMELAPTPPADVSGAQERKEGYFLLSDFTDMDACRTAAEAFAQTARPNDKNVKMDRPVFNMPATRFKFCVNNPQFRIYGETKTVIAIGLVSKLRQKWVDAGGEGRDLGDVVIPVIRLPSPIMAQMFCDWLNDKHPESKDKNGDSTKRKAGGRYGRPSYFNGKFMIIMKHVQRMKWIIPSCDLTRAINRFRNEFPMFYKFYSSAAPGIEEELPKIEDGVNVTLIPRELQKKEAMIKIVIAKKIQNEVRAPYTPAANNNRLQGKRQGQGQRNSVNASGIKKGTKQQGRRGNGHRNSFQKGKPRTEKAADFGPTLPDVGAVPVLPVVAAAMGTNL
jgi:hypothetical protein